MTTIHEEPRATGTYNCLSCGNPVNPGSQSFTGACWYCGDDMARSATNMSQYLQSQSEEMNRQAWTWYQRANAARQAASNYAERLAAEPSVAGPPTADQIPVEAAPEAEVVPSASPGSTPTAPPDLARTSASQGTQIFPGQETAPLTTASAQLTRQMRTPRERPTFGRHVEPAVLLQGLGALLLLAALTIITTVSWAFLPAVGQAGVLAVPLVVMGGSAIWLRDRLPTTSTVLALLTIGAGLVQAVALPELLTTFEFAWYPPLAAAVGAVIFGLAGRWGHVLVWRVFAIAIVPLIPILVSWVLVSESAVNQGSSAVVLTTVTAPFIGALLVVASRLRSRDATTAAVSWWVSAIMVPILGLALLGETVRLAQAGPDGLAQAIGWGFGVLLVSALAYGVGLAATGTGEAWRWIAAGLAVLPVPAILGWGIGAQTLWVLVPVFVFTTGLFAIALTEVASQLRGAVVTGLVVAQSAIIMTALSTQGQTWAWVLVSGSALGASAALFTYGVKRPAAAVCWLGLFGMLATWATLWLLEFVGPNSEALIWPMVAVVIASASVARPHFESMQSWWPAPGLPVLALAAGTPGVLASWQQHYVTGAVSGSTTFSLLVLVTLIAISAFAGWIPAPRTATVAVLSVVLLPHAWITLSTQLDIDAVLLVSVLAAVGVGLIGAFAVGEGLVQPTSVYVATTFTLLIGSTTLTILTPVDTWLEDRWRFWFVGLGLMAAIAVMTRTWPNVARILGAATLTLGLWWYLAISFWAWSAVDGGPPLEVWTGPTLLVLIAISTLVSWPVARGKRWDRICVVPVVLVLSASTAFVLITSVLGSGQNAIRTTLVLAAWVILATTAAISRRTTLAAAYASVAVLVLLDVSLQMIDFGGVEKVTYPAAAAVAAWTWLWVIARHAKLSTMLTIGPSVALVLLPSASVMWLGEPVMLRFWVTLTLAVVGLAVGLRFRLAGMVWPSALALIVLAAPVVVRWTQAAPMWIPLGVGGLVLLVVGARFEATRRAGRQAGKWVSALR